MKKVLLTFLIIFPFCSGAQDEKALISEIDNQLSSGAKTVSQVLTDPAYMKLHSLASFREIIRKNAKQEKISLVNKSEPGTRVTIKAKLIGSSSVADLLVYIYHTDNRGW